MSHGIHFGHLRVTPRSRCIFPFSGNDRKGEWAKEKEKEGGIIDNYHLFGSTCVCVCVFLNLCQELSLSVPRPLKLYQEAQSERQKREIERRIKGPQHFINHFFLILLTLFLPLISTCCVFYLSSSVSFSPPSAWCPTFLPPFSPRLHLFFPPTACLQVLTWPCSTEATQEC